MDRAAESLPKVNFDAPRLAAERWKAVLEPAFVTGGVRHCRWLFQTAVSRSAACCIEAKILAPEAVNAYWEQGRCQMGRACSFVHPEEKAEPCWYFQQGNCSKGASCAFSHEGFQQLLQQPSSPVADEELVKVPSHLVKSLIGPGGENFRLLQQVTGCQPVLVAAKDAGENEYCVVKLWGIPSHRVQARQLVEQHCKSEQKVKPMKEQAEGPIGKSLGAGKPPTSCVPAAFARLGKDVPRPSPLVKPGHIPVTSPFARPRPVFGT
ncbi:unnamed protein product [Effrenium voratum]|nr:unnamed protein product [Effrenium voratum]